LNHVTAYYANAKGERFRYQYWEGSTKSHTKAVILLHAEGCHGGAYPELTLELAKRNYKVYAPDIAGFGEGREDKSAKGLGELADDLEALRRLVQAQEGFREIVAIGHSLGAAILIAHALRYPRQEMRLALVALPVQGLPESVDFSKWCESAVAQEQRKKDPLSVTALPKGLALMVKELLEKAKDQAPLLNPRKAMFLAGEADEIAPYEKIKQWQEAFSFSATAFKTIPRLSHDPFADERRAQAIEAIVSWFGETEYATPAP
jgi:alpha-beta hydrolase superfamily lysophospholipase